MNREEDEQLWDLLGRSAAPKVSPFFARNVVRKIREAEGERSPEKWYLRWLMPVAGVAVVVIAGLIIPTQIVQRTGPKSGPETVAIVDAQDSDLIADIDDLVASDDSTGWDDGVLL
jgi:anti-sigma factor RsiW